MHIKKRIITLLIIVLPFLHLVANDNITTADRELICLAKDKLKEILIFEKHFVVAVIRTKTGQVFTGFNLKTIATRASVCAESIALAKMIEAGHKADTIVVIAQLNGVEGKVPELVSPCGICRELLIDYAPEVKIILSHQGLLIKLPITELLHHPYNR